jgi:hypothetical protein
VAEETRTNRADRSLVPPLVETCGARPTCGGLSELRFFPAPRHLASTGFLGHVRGRLGPVLIDLVVRRTASGRLTVVFPTRRDGSGREHQLVRPVDRAAREAIRQQVLAAAGLEDGP